MKRQPLLLMQRTYAALLAKDEAVIKEAVECLLEADTPVNVKLSAVKELAVYHHPADAASILLDDPTVRSDPRYLSASKQVFARLKDPALRARLKAAVSDVLKGGDRINPEKASFDFATQPPNEVWGTVDLLASPKTSPHHAEMLNGDAAKFRASMEASKQPRLLEYRNVFTDPSGQIWNEDGQVILSFGEKISTLNRSDVKTIPIGFAANRRSKGIYHWLIDYLARFGWIAESGILQDRDFRILINGEAPKFEQASLDLLGLGEATAPLTETVFVERLLVASVSFRGMVGWRHLDSVFTTLGERATSMAAEHGLALPDKVYITRRDADRRVMTNEAEIEALARVRGFDIYEFSAIPLWHQIALMRNAATIMAPHGAGLSHIIFSPPGTKIIELLPIKDGSYLLRFNYARLSIIKGHDYRAWVEEQYPLVNSWTVDIPNFKVFLDDALGVSRS
ncbi:glycosyltransferase family 61 protein [Methylobacterium marchantiae]|uniref:Glycosyltransferase family 61 protein n=1 Tax=Methylobacterium marchantiae TaxID=600331 RepID=A0ABW3X2H2_9HYPH